MCSTSKTLKIISCALLILTACGQPLPATPVSCSSYDAAAVERLIDEAEAYSAMGDNARGIALLKAAFDCGVQEAALFLARGRLHLRLYEWDQALADFDAALALNPNLAEAYYQRALLYASAPEGREARVQALADYERYLALAPDGEHAAAASRAIDVLRAQLEALGGL